MKLIEGNELKFSASGKDIATGFTKINGVTTYTKSDDTKFVIAAIKGQGKKIDGVYLIGTSTDALASMKISGEVEKAGTIRVDANTLTGLLKARTECNFKTGGGKIAFKEKKGNFEAHLDAMEFDADDIRMLEHQLNGEKTPPMDKAIVERLLAAVRRVNITDFYAKTELPVIFDIGEKIMRVYCYDEHHVALYRTKVKNKTPIRMALPAKAFTVIDKFIESDEVSFSTSGGRFRVTSPEFTVSIPETQLEESHYTMALQYNKSLDDLKPRTTMKFDTKAVATVSNMAVLTDGETRMAIAIADGEVNMHVQGKGGKVSDKFKAETTGKPLQIRVDPRIFMDLFNKAKDMEINMNFYKIPAAMSTYRFITKTDEGTLTLVGTYDEAK
jgi:DNA polymerase III sliding clamp (beta) subunit (PCNA family)